MTDRAMIRIANGTLSAAIDPFGAELHHLEEAQGRELMTDADPAFWTGHAPILFPVVGRPYRDTIRVDGAEYTMKQHGFARHRLFDVLEQGDDHATFVLSDDEETRAIYPFAFVLTVAFRLDGSTLHVEARVANPADTPLYASIGYHPAFAWPLPYGEPREAHRITFATDEPEPIRCIAKDGTIAAGERPSPLDGGRELLLRDALFDSDALVWDHVASQRITYGAAQGPVLDIAFPDTPKLGIWTKPGAHFVCVEPWHGIADPEGYDGEFKDKPGVFRVEPGEQHRALMSVTLVG